MTHDHMYKASVCKHACLIVYCKMTTATRVNFIVKLGKTEYMDRVLESGLVYDYIRNNFICKPNIDFISTISSKADDGETGVVEYMVSLNYNPQQQIKKLRTFYCTKKNSQNSQNSQNSPNSPNSPNSSNTVCPRIRRYRNKKDGKLWKVIIDFTSKV